MTTKKHKKHASIPKPGGGVFHAQELALIGAPCGIICDLATRITTALPDQKIAYIDADHGEKKEKPAFHTTYTDKIGPHEVIFQSDFIRYEYRHLLSGTDLALVNGNHYVAEHQIVLIHPKKEESLRRKLDRLDQVLFFVLDESMDRPFDFLFDHRPDWEGLPVYRIMDTDAITQAISNWLQSRIPPLFGLVLAGGKSTRMGQDKSLIDYHGKPHVLHLAQLLDTTCQKTRLSRATEGPAMGDFEVIADRFLGLGPYGGILSAFQTNPDVAWLTVATDIPLLDADTLHRLVSHRDPSKTATCFHNPETGFPEPLITIWEPRAYPRLLQFLSQGFSCPRKVLINSDIHEIHPENPEVLANANTPAERDQLKAKINHA